MTINDILEMLDLFYANKHLTERIQSKERSRGMTKEEAIAHIKDVICENNSIKPNMVVFEQEKEALYMAIQALQEQIPQDCCLTEFGECSYKETGCSDCTIKARIREALQEQKVGKWIEHPTAHRDFNLWVCSECGNEIDGHNKSAYCPNCGAKMEGAEE